jgi:hypothetical protein
VFTAKLEPDSLFVSGLTFVDANHFNLRNQTWPGDGLWFPGPEDLAFFQIDVPADPRSRYPWMVEGFPSIYSRYPWINSGVFAVRDRGFELCREAVGFYLKNIDRVPATPVYAWPDEILMNAVVLKWPDQVGMIDDYNWNFLAYFLCLDRAWPGTAKIVHFHAIKPNRFRSLPRNRRAELREDEQAISDELVMSRCEAPSMTTQPLENEHLHLAAIKWTLYLHTAGRDLPFEMPTRIRIPLDVARREHDRLFAKLGMW